MHAFPTEQMPATAMRFGGLRGVVEMLCTLAARGDDAVLAVVVETSGSTYRKPGALILLDADGVRVGALSGGCLEIELEAHARDVLASGCAARVRFNTGGDEDRVFGSGSGCGGSTQVLLLPVPAPESPLRDALRDAQAAGCGLALALDAATDTPGSGVAIVATQAPARRYAFDHRGAPVSAVDHAGTHLTIARTPRLLLLGAGPETPPLLQLSRLLGWQVDLAEHRGRWIRHADGCGIDRLHRDGPDALPGLLERERFDAALVMHHNFDLDTRGLLRLAASRVAWIGLLGPAARRDELLRELGDEAAARLAGRLHAPVGLPLGGEGAEAIALSIAAGLQQVFAGRRGR